MYIEIKKTITYSAVVSLAYMIISALYVASGYFPDAETSRTSFDYVLSFPLLISHALSQAGFSLLIGLIFAFMVITLILALALQIVQMIYLLIRRNLRN